MIKNPLLSTNIAGVGGHHQQEEIVAYLQKTVGPILVKGLAVLTIKRPTDPIEYLGHWLRHQHYVQKCQKPRDQANNFEVIRQRQAVKNDLLPNGKLENNHRVCSSMSLDNIFGRQGVTQKFPNLPTGYGELRMDGNLPIFTIVSAKIICPHSDYEIAFSVEDILFEPVNFTASIRCVDSVKLLTSGSILVQPNQNHATLRLPINELRDYIYLLTLKAESTVVCGGKNWEKSVTILASNLHFNIFAHTDRPRYKPGELVQFRVILLARDMKPVTSPAERHDIEIIVSIYISGGPFVKRWTDCHFQFGMFKGDLQLADDMPLGTWELVVDVVRKRRPLYFIDDEWADDDSLLSEKIASNEKVESSMHVSSVVENLSEKSSSSEVVEVPGNQFSEFVNWRELMENDLSVVVYFEVAEMILPKFYINLKTPATFYFNQFTKIPIEIETMYTYGKGVTGQVTITPEISPIHSYSNDDFENSPNFIPTTASLTAECGGKITVNVDLEGLLQSAPTKLNRKEFLTFRVEVTEQATGKVENAFSRLVIVVIDPSTNFEEVNEDDPISLYGDNDDRPLEAQNEDDDDDFIDPRINFSDDPQDGYDWSPKDKNVTSVVQFGANKKPLEYLKMTIEGQETPSAYTVYVESVSSQGNDQLTSLNYVIQGRSQILASGRVQLVQSKENEGWLQFDVKCPPRAYPMATLLVYQVREGILNPQIVIVGSVTFNPEAQADTSNSLEISFSQKISGPGQEIGLRVKTQIPENSVSLLALRCVDQSVLLRSPDASIEDNDIKGSHIDRLVEATATEGQSHLYASDVSAFGQFAYAGLIIQSNAVVTKPNLGKDRHTYDGGMGMGGGGMWVKERSKFPETWMWEEVILTNNGESTETQIDLFRTLPDTMTTWTLSGYVLNEKVGIGVMKESQKLAVFQPFFLSLNLPYSIVKGEILPLQVLIHNYLPETASSDPNQLIENVTQVIFDNSLGLFDLPEGQGRSTTSKVVTCPINSVTSCTFQVTAKKFGDLMIHVRGHVKGGPGLGQRDALAQPLRVTPPGEKCRKSVSTLINLGPHSHDRQKMTSSLLANFPNSRVEGTDRLKLTIMSDLLGHCQNLEKMDKLLHLPTGCGEQNMCNFVVDIVVLKYLELTNKQSAGVRARGVKFLETGYQREVYYVHNDGSFSCFGEEDPSGSTWLTAFVTKSFIQAGPFISIDRYVLQQAFKFLFKNQNSETGEFREPGRVLDHGDLQGATASSRVALTAFVVATFLEEFEEKDEFLIDDISTGIEKGFKFILENTNLNIQNDIYALILTTYVLHLGGHRDKDIYFDAANRLVLTSNLDGFMHWDKVDPNGHHSYPKMIENESAVAIEMTAYMLLVYLMRGELEASIPIVQWLSRQRNSGGGFKSTQDTVIGLTALAKFQGMTHATSQLNMNISAWPSQNGERKGGDKIEVRLDKKNAMDLQNFELSPLTPAVHFEAEGEGMALIQLNWSYFMESDSQKADNAFSLEVQTAKEQKTMFLKILTSFLLGGPSKMAIVEVNLPSGYTVDVDNMEVQLKKDLGSKFKRFEMKNLDTKLNVYLDCLDETGVSFSVLTRNEFDIGQPVKSFVTVYDYYEPEWKACTFY